MPKKFKGENSKAAEARARKAAAQHEKEAMKKQREEDEYWQDDDKHNAKKQQRKEEKEKKRNEQLERKKELQELHDKEMESIKSNKPAAASKLTRAQIESTVVTERQLEEAAAAKNEQAHDEVPLVENINRQDSVEGEARTVEEALNLLSVKAPEVDMHPEKRVKAAYLKFEEERLPQLKNENPNLRLSQLKQMLRKDWMKSPENPLNQRLMER